MTVIAIHQVNFFPYLGFFEKMAQSDIFVLMGQCQYEKNGYQNRFNIGNKWFTMSTNRGMTPIIGKKYLSPEKDWIKIKSGLPEYRKILDRFDDCISDNLWLTNSKIILRIACILGIYPTPTMIRSDYPTGLIKSERLCDIVKHYKGNSYLSGTSGEKYLDMILFNNEKIDVTFQQNPTNKPILEHLNEIIK